MFQLYVIAAVALTIAAIIAAYAVKARISAAKAQGALKEAAYQARRAAEAEADSAQARKTQAAVQEVWKQSADRAVKTEKALEEGRRDLLDNHE